MFALHDLACDSIEQIITAKIEQACIIVVGDASPKLKKINFNKTYYQPLYLGRRND